MAQKLAVLVALCASLIAVPVLAAGTACMDWECDIGTSTCTVDASCSTASPFIYRYFIDWGDGSPYYYGGQPTASHTYAYDPNSYFYTITMGILFWSEPSDDILTCQLVYRQVPVGPPFDYEGNCSN